MKKLMVASLFCLSSIAYAQSNNPQFVTVNKPILCGPLNIILSSLADKELNEKPVWTGKSDTGNSDYIVFLNFNTSAFTILEMGKEVGCILGLGVKSNFFKPPPADSVKSKISLPLHDSQQ